MTKEQALAIYQSNWWIGKGAKEIVSFQLFEDRLCMPFDKFHEAIQDALGRSVWTHEFGLNREGLQKEFLGDGVAPTMQQILEMIPEAKRIMVQL
jgi:hypothetical protein